MEVESREISHEALIIQHDWHLALKEPISTFFLGVKQKNIDKTSFFDVQVTKLIDEFGFTVLPQRDGNETISNFGRVFLDSLNNLLVEYNETTTVFVSPEAELKINDLETSAHTLDVSPSGKTFISADTSGNLLVASAVDGTTVKALKGHKMDIYKCLYFRSGLIVLTGGMDLTVRVWAVETGKCMRILRGPTQAVTGIGILGVGKEVLSCSNDGSAYKWNCATAKMVKKYEFEHGKCVALSVSADCSRFAVLCERRLLSVIDCYGNEIRRDIHLPSEPTAVVFSKKYNSEATESEAANLVFVGFEDGNVAAYNVTEKKMIGGIKTNRGRVTCIKYFNNRLLVSFNDGRVAAYRVPNTQDLNLSAGDANDSFEHSFAAEYELTGADCDPIYDIAINGCTVYTSCRDKIIRKYTLKWDC